jgi:hypothetical protein
MTMILSAQVEFSKAQSRTAPKKSWTLIPLRNQKGTGHVPTVIFEG